MRTRSSLRPRVAAECGRANAYANYSLAPGWQKESVAVAIILRAPEVTGAVDAQSSGKIQNGRPPVAEHIGRVLDPPLCVHVPK